MNAREVNLNKFLAQNDTQFVIPVYQRNYDWAHVQCKKLLDDVINIGNNENINAHFIGSIVYIHDDVYSASGITELTIIDGQQRLTTVTLIYLVIYKLAIKLKKDSLINRINETYLINKFSEEEEKLKLRPTENNDQVLKHLLRNSSEEEYSDFSRLIDNFNYFKEFIIEENYELVLKGLSKIMFVEISLDREKDDPQRIFESLNSTGLELSQADLIRNYILMGLKRKSQQKIYENYWEIIEKLAKEEKTAKNRVSDFIRDYLTFLNKKIPNKGKVYQEFKANFPTRTVEKLEDYLSPIKKFAIHYNKLLNPEKEQDQEIRLQIEYINRLEVNVAYPFLMKVYDDYSSKVIQKDIFVNILELIQSFVWRRFIIGLPTNALNKIFMKLYDDVDKFDYLASIGKSLLRKKGSQKFPSNHEVINALREKDVYGIKPKNRIYFFERLENFENKELVQINNLTIEHIFPQNPDAKWKVDLGIDEYNIIKENYLNTIANLTLSGNNGILSNKSFIQKRDMNNDGKEQGYKYSRLWLNRYLSTIDKLGKAEIEERFILIKERFLKVWKFPLVEINESVPDEVNIFDVDDPTNKKLEYVIFLDEKLQMTKVSELYSKVMKTLFDLEPEPFFNTELLGKLNLTQDKNKLRQALALNETYFIESNFSNKIKFEQIKTTLTIFNFEDELIIKFK
ncbi:MAG: DUF262 domain-containing protein [Thiomargarita sp.]|nr:DUF262 domain-containing protein [Thiomargarita sp.]